jgi:hypothetical protein
MEMCQTVESPCRNCVEDSDVEGGDENCCRGAAAVADAAGVCVYVRGAGRSDLVICL